MDKSWGYYGKTKIVIMCNIEGYYRSDDRDIKCEECGDYSV